MLPRRHGSTATGTPLWQPDPASTQLAAQSEFFHGLSVYVRIRAVEVALETASPSDKHQQSTPRVEIVLVCAQMIRQFDDAPCEESYLDRRGSDIAGMSCKSLNQFGLVLRIDGQIAPREQITEGRSRRARSVLSLYDSATSPRTGTPGLLRGY